MSEIALVVQCGDMGVKWIPYFLHYYNKNWNCDDFIDTLFLFENEVPEIKTHNKNVYTSQMGKVKWGQGMIDFLRKINYKYILLFHEDYFITGKQDKRLLKKLIKIMNRENMNLLKICGDWSGNTATEKKHIGELSNNENVFEYSRDGLYITSHQPSIWKVEYLLKTIKPEYNPWKHEMDGHGVAKDLRLPVHTYMGIAPIPFAECVTAKKIRPGCESFFEVMK